MIFVLTRPDEIAEAEAVARDRLAKAGHPAEWARVGRVFEDQYLRIDRCGVRFRSGALGTYLRVELAPHFAGGVAAVARHDGKIVLVRQFRFASQQEHLEVPRGFLGREEDLTEAAKRELEEETGSVSLEVEPLGHVWPDNGLLAWRVYVLGIRVASVGNVVNDEIADVCELPISEIDSAIESGQIDDGLSLSALLLARTKKFL